MTSPVSIFQGLARDVHLSDGSLRGVTGPLVKIGVPSYTGSTQGTSTVTQSALATAAVDNPDGSASIVNLAVPNALPNTAVIRTELYGRVIGVRWWRRPVTTTVPFDVVIDGAAYPVDDVVPRRDNRQQIGSGPQQDYEALAILATGLADTVHTVEVHATPDPQMAVTAGLYIFGFIVERGKGYNDVLPKPRAGAILSSSTLTTSAAGITSSITQVYGGLSFHNTDGAAPHTVTITGPGGGIYKVLTLAAGTSGSITFPSPRYLNTWQWKADAGSVVTGWAENL